MADAVNSPYLKNGKLLLNCTEELIEGNMEILYFCSTFFPFCNMFFVVFRIDIYQNSQVRNIHVPTKRC